MDFRALKSSTIELSSTRELNFHNFEMLVSRSNFDRFWGQVGSQNRPKMDKKSINNLINKVIDSVDRVLIDFCSILGAKLGPSWHQNPTK